MTKVEVISPVLFNKGESLNGIVIDKPEWVYSGSFEIDDEKAKELERAGYVDIISVNGADVVWESCCSGSNHTH